MDEETPEVLDDLRQKRLAYFDTRKNACDNANTSAQSVPCKDDQVLSGQEVSLGKGIVFRQCSAENGTRDSGPIGNIANKYQRNDKSDVCKTQTETNNESSSRNSCQTGESVKQTECTSSDPLKTSSFYFPSPNKTTENATYKTTDSGQQDAKNATVFKSVPKSSVDIGEKGEPNRSQQDDGYNETVERLIRATKEQLLGLQSTDDIWKNIRNTDLSGSTTALDSKTEQTNEGSEEKDTSDAQHRSDNRAWQQMRTNSESESHEYLSGSLNSFHEAQSLNKPKLFSQTSVPAGVKYQNFEMYPAPSRMEPFHPKAQKVNQDTQKSLNSNTVEELFSSRQMARSMTQPQYNGNVVVSQEIETNIPLVSSNQQSVDLSDLGLSTHRPESGRKEEAIKVEADDINLGDTVTQELRTLLGEDKFQQFLIKSKKDIDDLHQDKMSDISDGSARRDRTPRLLKDRPILPKKPNTPTSDRKPFKAKNDKTIKKHIVQKDNAVSNIAKETSKTMESRENKENSTRKSQDFTPRESDGDVVNNLIGKYVLNQTELDKKLTTNPALKTKTKLKELKDEKKASSPKPVPDLNLEALQNDSPRPKLNRPKHEPATIYSEKPKVELSDRDSFNNSSDGKQSPGRNYEQVIVPRNVAFSANEIYHQAYGVNFVNQSANVSMSPSFLGHGQNKPQFSGPAFAAPLTPKTPTGSGSFADPAGYNQYYLGQKSQGQNEYPPGSGMSYHGMPLTPVTPHGSPSHLYSSGEDGTNLGQYVTSNTQQFATANENFEVSTSQSASQPYMHAPYSQMYGMMSDFRGYPAGMAPPHAVRMAPPTGLTPSMGMTPPTSMTSPRFPVPVASVDQSMHIPHPPVSVAASQQFNQSTVSTAYSSAQSVQMAYPYPYPVMMVTPHPPGDPPYTPSTVQPQTPQTSHAEVQTEERTCADDKVTLVEESTFTSVSQIKVDEEVIVPHPPSTKKGSRSSPRKPPKVAQAGNVQKNQRHIEGIRQHHEQRRQQQEEEKLSEEQVIEKQRKFAKQSLERYFSSLENLYMPSSKVSSSSVEVEPKHVNNVDAASVTLSDEIIPETERTKEDDGIVDDVLSEVNIPEDDKFNLVVPGFVDFRQCHKENVISKESWKLQLGDAGKENYDEGKENNVNVDNVDNDGETLVNSARTGVSIKAGGLTERLKEIGVDAHGINNEDEGTKDSNESSEIVDKKPEEKKGKVLIVCPDCQGLNKKYMSWCTHCGEIIIGVEPMLVSKNKQGKIRVKPLTNIGVESERQTEKDIHISVKDGEESKEDVHVEQDEEDEVLEKPFTLNLDVIKSPSKESNEGHNASPSKSDGKDSGRPSSEDNDLQNYKIEQEVVNDICETITDPVLKGYLKSHFAKKSHAVLDKSQGKTNLLGSLLPTSEEKETIVDDIVVERVGEENLIGGKSVDLLDDQTVKQDLLVGKNWHETKDVSSLSGEKEIVKSKEITSLLENKLNLAANSLEDSNKHRSDFHSDQSAQYKKNTHTEPAISDNIVSKSFNEDSVNAQSHDLTQSMKMHEMQLDEFSTSKSAFKEEDEKGFLDPPPIPKFSAALPVPQGGLNELRLKLPANSMDFSEDFSQAESMNFDKTNAEEIKKSEKRRKEREERRQERRKSRGHGAIDVEVFGYEETRDCRNSSRGLRLVPVLNLAGNSSDEDDMSVQSDSKSDMKLDVKLNPDVGYQQQPSNAWEAIPESPEIVQEQPEISKEGSAMGQAVDMSNTRDRNQPKSRDNPEPVCNEEMHQEHRTSNSVQDDIQPLVESNENWKQLFDPQSPEVDDIPEDLDDTEIPELDKPFLEQVVSQPQPKKSKRRPISARARNVKSKVRQSIEEPGYQRKWARSSTAWSSFNQAELNTASSLQSSCDSSRIRPASAPKVRGHDNRVGTSSPAKPAVGKPARPLSADLYRRKQQKQKKSKSPLTDLDLDPVEDMIEHRLPRPGMLDRLQGPAEAPDPPERMASPGSTYDKYLQMTPRIEAGTVSRWQCLPDEILLHIFAYLDQTTLTQCAQVCHQFYRVAMDESLWKYITIKKKAHLDDKCLMEIAKRHPISLALIQCYGDQVTAKGLRDLFRECANSLKELNVGRCSRGALNGDSILLHAAARCHNITHVDTSWCNVTDSGLMAISNCCNRLESLCISGCQTISNDGLETVIKKHGPHLRVLEMFGCFNIGPRGLRCISNNCINLISANLGQCYKLTDSCVAQLSSSLGRVETLDLRGLKQIKDNCIRRVVKNCTRLKHLSLANCPNITDVSVLEIATYLTDIRSVDLCGCKNVTDNSIRALVNTCTNLRHIDISSTGCTHRSVSMIANFCGQRLETLKINFLSDVTEQSLIKLAKHCLKLKSVHMYGCNSIRNMDKINHERPTFKIEM